MFRLSNFADKAYHPHGQTIHVASMASRNAQCDEWVVVDYEHAVSMRFGNVVMNWPANSHSDNVHWAWECDRETT